MTITVGIRNFRSYLTNPNDPEGGFFRFRFEGGVNLLKGGSGAGKSTVFMAIFWCLYKKPALGNAPIYKDTGKVETSVFFHVEDEIRVTRRSPGSLLTVTILDDPSEPTLENEEAQNYIYRRFGRETVWKTCNYVQQGLTNPMISGELNEAQRWDVLYGITLDTDPQNKVTIDRLKNNLRLKLETCSREKTVLDTELELHSRTMLEEEEERARLRGELEALRVETPLLETPLGKQGVKWGEAKKLFEQVSFHPHVGDQDLVTSRQRVEDLQKEIEELGLRISNHDRNLKQLEEERDSKLRGVENEIEKLNSQLKPLKDKSSTLISGLEKCKGIREGVRKMCGNEDLVERLEGICQSASTFSEFQSRACRLIGRAIWLIQALKSHTLQELETPTENIERVLSYYGFQRRKESLKSALKTAEEILLTELQDEGLKRIFEENRDKPWKSFIPEETPSPGLKDNRTTHLVVCPCCNTELRAVIDKPTGKTILVEPWKQEKPRIARIHLAAIRDRDLLLKTLMEIPDVKIDEGYLIKEEGYWSGLLSKAEIWNREPGGFRKAVLNILPLAENVDCSELSTFQSVQPSVINHDLYKRMDDTPLETWAREIETLEFGLETSRERREDVLRTYERRISEMRSGESSRLTILKLEGESRLRECLRSLGEMERIRKLWVGISKLGFEEKHIPQPVIERVESILSRMDRLDVSLREGGQRTGILKEGIREISGKEEAIRRLQLHLETVEADVLSESIRKISGSANEFLENCFESPVLVQLTTERESKTGKGKKHSVNLSIKSGKKDGALLERGLEGFSGGETDRISLGFSSAITGFSPFPMLLLDECISSLDSDMKDKTIRALRVQAKRLNKSIILVCHDAVEGLFDHVCELE